MEIAVSVSGLVKGKTSNREDRAYFFHAEWGSRWFTTSLFSWRTLRTVPSFQRIKFQKFNPLIKLNAMGEFSGYSNFQQNLSDIVQFQQH